MAEFEILDKGERNEETIRAELKKFFDSVPESVAYMLNQYGKALHDAKDSADQCNIEGVVMAGTRQGIYRSNLFQQIIDEDHEKVAKANILTSALNYDLAFATYVSNLLRMDCGCQERRRDRDGEDSNRLR